MVRITLLRRYRLSRVDRHTGFLVFRSHPNHYLSASRDGRNSEAEAACSNWYSSWTRCCYPPEHCFYYSILRLLSSALLRKCLLPEWSGSKVQTQDLGIGTRNECTSGGNSYL